MYLFLFFITDDLLFKVSKLINYNYIHSFGQIQLFVYLCNDNAFTIIL